jgi:hypothetical protein
MLLRPVVKGMPRQELDVAPFGVFAGEGRINCRDVGAAGRKHLRQFIGRLSGRRVCHQCVAVACGK